jgi:hypothetical protein
MIAAALEGDTLNRNPMALAPAVVPAKYHRRAGAQSQRGRGRRGESRASEKGHVIARGSGVLIDQKSHQMIAP